MSKTPALSRFKTTISIVLVAALFLFAVPSRAEDVPPVVGTFEGINFNDGKYYAMGWALQEGHDEPLAIHLYADASAYDNPPGTHILSGTTDRRSRAELNEKHGCSPQSMHNFKIYLPDDILKKYGGHPLYIHGLRAVEGTTNTALTRSGKLLIPCPFLQGEYKEGKHPCVFATQADLDNYAKRINTPGTFSRSAFDKLTEVVRQDLNSKRSWSAAYSGTDIDVYLHTFSYESLGGYKEETRSEDQLNQELRLEPSAKPPLGAAVVASRAALYAALLKAGAKPSSASAPKGAEASALAKRILLAWAKSGFRDEHGNFMKWHRQFSENGKFSRESAAAVGLQISRGMIYSVYAQDVLAGIGLLTGAETAVLDDFHDNLAQLVRTAANNQSSDTVTGLPCNCFGNHQANVLAALLAEARLVDSPRKFSDALYGGASSSHVNVPWNLFFNKTIYGVNDTANKCYENGPDFFQLPNVAPAPGEMDDRFRALPNQAIGYPMFTLRRLFDAANVIKNSGFDAYGYRGVHGQSIEEAAAYYACYAQHAGFEQTITDSNCLACPDHQQYAGKIATGAPQMVQAAYWFRNNKTLQSLQGMAKQTLLNKSSGLDVIDAPSFARWQD